MATGRSAPDIEAGDSSLPSTSPSGATASQHEQEHTDEAGSAVIATESAAAPLKQSEPSERTTIAAASKGFPRLSVVFGDPGRSVDPFGFCWLEWWPSFRRAQEQRAIPAAVNAAKSADVPFIRVRAAQQFFRRPYAECAAWALQLRRQVHPDIIALESNGQGGKAALAAFRAAGLSTVKAVACSGASCTEERMRRGTAYSKEAVIAYAKAKIEAGLVLWERGPWIQEMRQQLLEFKVRAGPSGAKTYSRMLGRHDDLAMAFLGAMSIARRAEKEWEAAVLPARAARAAEEEQARETARLQAQRDKEIAEAALLAARAEGRSQMDGVVKASIARRNRRVVQPPVA